MPRVHLTDRFIASLKPRARVNYFDAKETGLVLRVTPRGTKSWSFTYRAHVGERKGKFQWMSLGEYSELNTLADARQKARKHRHDVGEGHDPVSALRSERLLELVPTASKEFTFADLAGLYEAWAKGRKKTWRADVSKMKTYLLPAWGAMPVRSITRTHVHELLDTLVAKGMTIGVNRVQALISRLFTLALDRSLIDAHPASRMMKRFKETAVERVLTDDELRALWEGLDERSGRAADAMRLRLLLGQRGDEIAGMEWAEVDLDAKVWEIPGRRTKNGRPHTVPLATMAASILTRRRAEVADNEPRVFPGLSLTSDDHRALSDIHGGAFEWKDLRRTVATRLAALGFDESTIGRVLNHARYTVTARHYNKHAYVAEIRTALDAWDGELGAIISGTAKRLARVAAFRRPDSSSPSTSPAAGNAGDKSLSTTAIKPVRSRKVAACRPTGQSR